MTERQPMIITITIDTSNAAFDNDFKGEISYILKDVARKFRTGNLPEITRDINGNTVGTITYENI